MTRQTDITRCKIEFLKQFDYYVKNIIGDDDITDLWLTYGVPDEATEDDLREIAISNILWLDCVNCFSECCKRAGAY